MKLFILRVQTVLVVLMALLVLGGLVVLGSCRGAFDPQAAPAVKAASQDQAVPARAMPGSVSLDASLYTFDIDAEGPSGEGFAVTGLGATDFPWTSSTPILPGIWDMAVTVRDEGGTIIGAGTDSRDLVIENVDGGLVEFALSLEPVPGNGTLSFSLQWDSGDLDAGSADIELMLEPGSTGLELDLRDSPDLDLDFGGGSASFAGLVPAGSYLLRARLLSDGHVVWGHAESVLVLADALDAGGMETGISIVLPAGTENSPPEAHPSMAGGAFIPARR